MGLDEKLKWSDYDYLKINATLLKDNKEVISSNAGLINLKKDTKEIAHKYNINDVLSSKYGSVYFPITTDIPTTIEVLRSAENNDVVDTIKVNSIEFIKLEDENATSVEADLSKVIEKGTELKSSKVVFVFAYNEKVTAYNGIGGLASSDWTDNSTKVSFNADGEPSVGKIVPTEIDFSIIKQEYDNGYININVYNGACLQYIYLK